MNPNNCTVVPQLKYYHVSEITGFLLEYPLTDLPEYFKPWMTIGKAAGLLLKTHKLRDEIDVMPLLEGQRLCGHKQLMLADLILSVMTSGYVWQDGDQGIAKIIPRQLAIPMCYVADKLGLPVILTHSAICLANWQLIDDKNPIGLSNFSTVCGFPGGSQSTWFFMVTAQVELMAVPGLKAIVHAQEGTVEGDSYQVQLALDTITDALRHMKSVLERMFEHLSTDTFYNVIRPYLAGWGGPNSPAPDGIVFQGVSDEPKKATGGSAAQSPPIQCFDAALNIQHTKEHQDFLDMMRQYMLPSHRSFIEAVRAGPSVRNFVMSQNCEHLTKAYNEAVRTLGAFRSYHIQLTTRYIVIPARKNRTGKFESVSKKGTGGTELIPFLKSIRDSTKQFEVQTNDSVLKANAQ